jgi:hypothetical protein
LDFQLTSDDEFWVTPQPYLELQPRDSEGRGTLAQTTARRLKTLELYANLSSARAITKFITDLGYSVTTAKEDLAWAKAQWLDMSDTEETVHVIRERHKEKYYQWAQVAELAGDTKLAADMLGRIERIFGMHAPATMVQVNNAQASPYNLQQSHSVEQLYQLRQLLLNPAHDA